MTENQIANTSQNEEECIMVPKGVNWGIIGAILFSLIVWTLAIIGGVQVYNWVRIGLSVKPLFLQFEYDEGYSAAYQEGKIDKYVKKNYGKNR